MQKWVSSLSLAQKKWLVDRTDTQALYGDEVTLLETKGKWQRIAAKDQYVPYMKAGYLHGEEEKDWLRNLIGTAKNIEYVGTLSEDSLKDYYRRAKVFALPSYSEGVGMVAMEATDYGWYS